MKVQFGSGGNRLDGWDNREIETDISKPLPFKDACADELLAEHVCEHVSTPDFFRFLLECKRILKPGGKLWISMPVLDYLQGDHARDIILGHGHLAAYTSDLLLRIFELAEFSNVWLISALEKRPEIFGHWRAIGESKDNLESFRVMLVK